MPRRAIAILLVLQLLASSTAMASDPGPQSSTGAGEEPVTRQSEILGPSSPSALLSAVDGHFTENLGQLGEGAGRYYCIDEPLSVAFGESWVAYDLHPEGSETGAMFSVHFPGGHTVSPEGVCPLSHRSNFFIGNDPEGWVTGAGNYERVAYRSLYEGIDLVYHFKDGRLKYDLIVHPGADPSQIRMAYSGVEGISIEECSGDLLIDTPVGAIRDTAPVTYQLAPSGQVMVECSYGIGEPDEVSFRCGRYDPTLPLVIDPGLEFSTFIGGNGADYTLSYLETKDFNSRFCVDDAGYVYLLAHTGSSDLPITPGAYCATYNGFNGGLIAKVRNDGTALEYATYFGGTDGYIYLSDVVTDDDGCAYVCGMTRATDLPVTAGVVQGSCMGYWDVLVMKLNETGEALLFSTYLGGNLMDFAYAISFDDSGNLLFAGATQSTDFPVVDGSYDTSHDGDYDGFVAKIDPSGTQLMKSTFIGGEGVDDLRAIGIAENGTVYVVGLTDSDDLPVSGTAYDKTPNDGSFVAKFNGTLDGLVYCTYTGGGWFQSAACDGSGNIYLYGQAGANMKTTSDAINKYMIGQYDLFIAELDARGEKLLYGTYLGGKSADYAGGIHYEKNGDLVISGFSYSDDFPTTKRAYDRTLAGMSDAFVARINSSRKLEYSTYIGGIGSDASCGAVHHGYNTTIVGYTSSPDFPTTEGAFDRTHEGTNHDLFVTRLWTGLPWDATPPSRPRFLELSAGNRNVTLEWSIPGDWGGGPVLGYRIYRGLSEDNMSMVAQLEDRTNYTDRPPMIGPTYYYSVSAFNGKGEGDATGPLDILTYGSPDVPNGFKVTPSCTTALLEWEQPSDDGGHSLLGYRILRGTDDDKPAHYLDVGTVTSYLDGDLTNGVKYSYQVLAFNSIGDGEATPVVESVPFGPPTSPRHLDVNVLDSNAVLDWIPPANEGGVMLQGYRILRGTTEDGLEELDIVDWFITTFTDSALTKGLKYHYAVLAFNEVGNSSLSNIVNVTVLGPPEAPKEALATPSDGRVNITWEPPDNTGGLPIVVYSIYRGLEERGLLFYLTVEDTTFTDTGLDNGETYYYMVSAHNELGEGPKCPLLQATPVGPPQPPSDVAIEVDVEEITLTWAPPADTGGRPLTMYIVYRGEASDEPEPIAEVDPTESSYRDTDVDVGVVYHYSVSAETSWGEGDRTITLSVMAVGLPGPPTGLEARPGNGMVNLTWSPPTDNGSSPILGYIVLRGSSEDVLFELRRLDAVSTYIDRDVENDITYYYSVLALNKLGQGEQGPVVSATPTAPEFAPGKVSGLTSRVHGTKAVLTWEAPAWDGGALITGYIVLRGRTVDEMNVTASLGLSQSYIDRGLEREVTYYYSVLAVNSAGEGEPSESVEFNIPKEVTEEVDDGGGVSTTAIVGVATVVVIAIVALVLIAMRRRG